MGSIMYFWVKTALVAAHRSQAFGAVDVLLKAGVVNAALQYHPPVIPQIMPTQRCVLVVNGYTVDALSGSLVFGAV